jgi:hypothetical protein
MTNTIALYLGIVILIGVGLDLALNDGAALVFLARKLVGLVEWVAFWR